MAGRSSAFCVSGPGGALGRSGGHGAGAAVRSVRGPGGAGGAAAARSSTVRMVSTSDLSSKLKKLTDRLSQQKEKVEVLERMSDSEEGVVMEGSKDPRVAEILEQNDIWRKKVMAEDPTFFDKIATVQTPEILWIGCSDSRVMANEILNMNPGDVFVHRNIANCVVHSDLNCLSVMEYAIKYLGVKRVVVCGHYGCGGVKAAMTDLKYGAIDNWLRHIRDVARMHTVELSKITDEDEKYRRLCELHAIEQAHNVCTSTIVQSAWDEGSKITVHAWIYDLSTGLLKDLGVGAAGPEAVNSLYRTPKSAG
mmetsp:Transcript_7768/g.16631  ORF Transcript_7768/g.16631 Transcript_7768/m.16631 type:complete len:308 (-) Transcript_7768:316-1239(-)